MGICCTQLCPGALHPAAITWSKHEWAGNISPMTLCDLQI